MTAMQAAIDGSLLTLCSKLPSQAHIASAYAKHAPMRSKLVADLQAALEPLQVISLLMHLVLHHCMAMRGCSVVRPCQHY